MRLERLDLSPYGRFADHSLRLSPDAALHVVLGSNESGKTTTLSAIGDLLFGFPRDTPYAFEHDQRELRVGGAIRLGGGALLDVRRRKGNKDTLLDPQNRPLPDAPLQAALGGVDRRTFETEFGLTALGLRRGGEALLSAGGALAETLAAGSASLSALNALRHRLAAEAEALFGQRRAGGKPFYVALDRHDAAVARLRDAIVTSEDLKRADDALLAARAREVDLKGRHEEAGRAVARLRRVKRVQAKLARLDAVAAELDALADLPAFAASALAATRAAAVAASAKRAERERIAAQDARDAAQRATLGLDPTLVAQGAAIDALATHLGAVRKAEEDLSRRLGEQTQARARLDEIARRLGLDGHAELLGSAPSDAALARAKTLIETRARARERRAEATERRRDALAQREALAGGPSAIDPAPHKRRLDGFADALADAERLTRERAQNQREARALAEETAALDPPVADLDALARRPLPDEEACQARLRAEEAAEEALRTAEQALTAAKRAVEAGEAEQRRRESGGEGATRADWQAARARRDVAFAALEAALDGPDDLRRERWTAARALTETADRTVESLLADADRAARLQAAREDLTARRADLTRADSEVAVARAARDAARARSHALWDLSGVAPRDAVAMAQWRKRVAALLLRRSALENRRADQAALAERIDAARIALAALFPEAGAAEAFEEAHRAARAWLEGLHAAWLAARERQAAAAQAEKTIAEAEALLARIATTEAAANAEWPAVMQDIKLRGKAGVEEAQAALAAWADAPLPRQSFIDTGHRIETMQSDIAEFENAVAAVISEAAPALASLRASDALARLTLALADARRASDEDKRLARAAGERAAARQNVERELAALQESLAGAQVSLGTADEAALAAALERLERRQTLSAEREALRRDLVESGDSLDEAQMRAEQAAADLAALPAHIELAEQEQRRLLHEIGEAAAAASAADAAREALARGRDAVSAARERVEAADELVETAERWLLRAAAAKLAGRAIERHRAAAQDPLIARAGTLFALATAGSFAGLGVGYDEGDQPILVAKRSERETVKLSGLSEGARDQLFLSLRLALLERRAGEPLPFIGDDLLASFDDERTRHTLELLAEFGAGRQTILFTHHGRVAELARSLHGRSVEVLEM